MRWVPILAIFFVAWARAGDLTIHVPAEQKVISAQATSHGETVTGKVAADGIHFDKLKPGAKYDITLESSDGHVDQGVDSGWYDDEAPDPKTAAMDDDDRQQIQSILKEIKSFYDRTESIAMWGDHDRAVVLVQRIRETKFHSAKDGEAIWRVELWYLNNEAGGWAKINQQDRMLRRERFESSAKMNAEIAKIRWRPELGGVKVEKDQNRTIELQELTIHNATTHKEAPR
jgi:hypothetical protein